MVIIGFINYLFVNSDILPTSITPSSDWWVAALFSLLFSWVILFIFCPIGLELSSELSRAPGSSEYSSTAGASVNCEGSEQNWVTTTLARSDQNRKRRGHWSVSLSYFSWSSNKVDVRPSSGELFLLFLIFSSCRVLQGRPDWRGFSLMEHPQSSQSLIIYKCFTTFICFNRNSRFIPPNNIEMELWKSYQFLCKCF